MRWFPLLPLALLGCNELQPLSTADDGSNAVEAWGNARGDRVEAFDFGADARNEVVDVLFVLDNSVSMKPSIRKVREGFTALAKQRFPAEARMAVLSTLPADPDDLDRPHPSVDQADRVGGDPGFGRLVDRDSLLAARDHVEEPDNTFKRPGCDAWFHPSAKNELGQRCLIAHTQAARHRYEAEAGLTAVMQLLERNAGKPTFRPGASVNIVFVSDTHDPGLSLHTAAPLVDLRPTGAELVEQLLIDNPVSSVRLHAIAPARECVEKWRHLGPTYFDAVDATEGVRVDICEAQDYTPIFEQILDVGAAPQRPVFSLAHRPDGVDEVLVDGEPAPYRLHPDLPLVELERVPALPSRATGGERRRIEVRYHAADAPYRPAEAPPRPDDAQD